MRCMVSSYWTAIIILGASSAAAECPLRLGEVVEITPPEKIAEIISRAPSERDTFETTEAFEARRSEALLAITRDTVVSFTGRDHKFPNGEPSTIKYDPDQQKVYYTDYFFSNSYDPSVDAYRESGQIDTYSNAVVSIPLQTVDTVLGTYAGGNSLGASVEVVEIKRNILTISQGAPGRERSYSAVFTTDEKALMPGRKDASDVMSFSLPTESAREEYFNLKPVIAFRLEEPFLLRHKGYIGPVMAHPVERNIFANVLVGEIFCGGIVDSKGQVLDIAKIDPRNL